MVKPVAASAMWSSSLTLMVVWSISPERTILLGWSLLHGMIGAVLTAWFVVEQERLRMEHLAELMTAARDHLDEVTRLR